MKTWFGQWGSPLLTTFIILTMVIAFAAAVVTFSRLAHGAVIDPHVISPFYITVVAEKGDTAYSIAKPFTPKGQSVMPIATAFVAFNNLKYNRKGNPVVHARRLYAFPTQLSRDRMQGLALSLNTASRDWHREHHTRMHGAAGTHQVTGADAHYRRVGPSALEKVGAASKGNGGTDVSVSQAKTEEQTNVTSARVLFVSVLLGMVVWILAGFSYREDILKLDVALASSAQSVKEPQETNAPSPAPDEKKGETANGVSESEALPQSVSKPDAAPVVKEEPPIQDTDEPYSDPAALTGIRPEQQMLNLIWMRPVEEVVALLDFDTVPIAVGRPGGKYEVKWVKLGNLRKSLEVHPEWKGKTLYDLIVGQQTAVATTIMAGGEVPPSQT